MADRTLRHFDQWETFVNKRQNEGTIVGYLTVPCEFDKLTVEFVEARWLKSRKDPVIQVVVHFVYFDNGVKMASEVFDFSFAETTEHAAVITAACENWFASYRNREGLLDCLTYSG